MATVRILVADDHEVVRRGLRELLEAQSGWEVVGEAMTGREAVESAKRLKPDVVLMDVAMPSLNGLEATRQIQKTVPGTQVLILTIHESEQLVRNILEAGARGYLLKSDAARDLVAAVDFVRQQRPFFTTKVAKMVLDGYLKAGNRAGRDTSLGTSLTAREREIVQLLAEGKTSKEVAAALGITVKTAETHRAHLMRKLDLRSVSDLVRYAVRNNIVCP